MLLQQIVTATLLYQANLDELRRRIGAAFVDYDNCVHVIGDEDILSAIMGTDIACVVMKNVALKPTIACKPDGYIITYKQSITIPIASFFSYRKLFILPGNKSEISNLHSILGDVSILRPKYFLVNNTLTVSGFDCPPYMYFKNFTLIDGLEKDIIDYIAADWNVEYIWHKPSSWDAVVEEVVDNHTSDVAGCAQWDIKGVFGDMPQPYGSICGTFLVPKAHVNPEIVYGAFSQELWLALLAALIATIASYYTLSRILIANESFAVVCLNLFRITTTSNIKKLPTQPALNMVIFFWCLTIFLLSTAFSAGLASFLTSPRFFKPIRTYQDLAESEIKCYETGGNYTRMALKFSPNAYIQHLGDVIISIDEYPSGVNYCYDAEIYYGHFVVPGNEQHDFKDNTVKVMTECFGDFTVRFVLKKNSPFTRSFDKAVVKFVEHGLIYARFEQLKFKDYSNLKHMESLFSEYVDFNKKPLSLRSLKCGFVVLVFGYLLGVIVFVVENIFLLK